MIIDDLWAALSVPPVALPFCTVRKENALPIRITLLLCCTMLLCGCTQQSEAEVNSVPAAAAPTPVLPLETPTPESLEEMLMSHAWQDVYDDSFWLEFDLRQGTMTEHNRALESKTTYRITVDKENSVFLAETGSEKVSFPFTLDDGFLTVDFGAPIGNILYQAVEKTT